MKFVDRKNELETLNRLYNKNGSSMVIIYGRRRVGKTALIQEFIQNKPSVYFLASQEKEDQNQKEFQNLIASFSQQSILNVAEGLRWDDLFRMLIETKTDGKKILVIDEFQYLCQSNKAFPSIMQRIWDNIMEPDRNIMLMLCGSYIRMMESETLSYTSPLYGRRDAQIKLGPIPFLYYQDFMPEKNEAELIEYYSITGGIPYYIKAFQGSDDIFSAIETNILSQHSILFAEPYFLLQNEVREIGSFFSIIKTIAAGERRVSGIASQSGVAQSSIQKYMETLIQLELVGRRVPVTETNPEKSKKSLYYIKDHFLAFWFRYVFPSRASLERGKTGEAMQRIRQTFIENHVSFVYEDICTEKLWQLSEEGKLGFLLNRVGHWWNKHEEIDLVGLGEDNHSIIFGECKYTKRPIGPSVLRDLERKASLVPWNAKDRKESFVLFSPSGYTQSLKTIAQARDDVLLI